MSPVSLSEIPYPPDPLGYFERLLDLPHPVLFDSGRPFSRGGRYDIFSAAPLYTFQYQEQCYTHSRQRQALHLDGHGLQAQLKQELGRIHPKVAELPSLSLPFYGGLAGYLSYDLGRAWEKLPLQCAKDIDLPELFFGYYPWAGVLDHDRQRAYLSFLPDCPRDLKEQVQSRLAGSSPPIIKTNKFKLINELNPTIHVDSYIKAIERIQQYIQSGDCYQVNFAQRFSGSYQGDPWDAYCQARQAMPAPFGGYIRTNSHMMDTNSAILCFSPERFMKLERGAVLTQPIKGTARRDPDPQIDQHIAELLQQSEKNRAENLMIVDLLRNDLGRCCAYGAVTVEKLFELQTVSNVHHLVSSIRGQLATGKDAFDLLRATFPGGSITGAPKIRSMEIIEELEPYRRSIYCGSLAYININGDMDCNITIRTLLCHEGKLHCWGGGGIVADSDPLGEYQESLLKVRPLLNTINQMKSVN